MDPPGAAAAAAWIEHHRRGAGFRTPTPKERATALGLHAYNTCGSGCHAPRPRPPRKATRLTQPPQRHSLCGWAAPGPRIEYPAPIRRVVHRGAPRPVRARPGGRLARSGAGRADRAGPGGPREPRRSLRTAPPPFCKLSGPPRCAPPCRPRCRASGDGAATACAAFFRTTYAAAHGRGPPYPPRPARGRTCGTARGYHTVASLARCPTDGRPPGPLLLAPWNVRWLRDPADQLNLGKRVVLLEHLQSGCVSCAQDTHWHDVSGAILAGTFPHCEAEISPGRAGPRGGRQGGMSTIAPHPLGVVGRRVLVRQVKSTLVLPRPYVKETNVVGESRVNHETGNGCAGGASELRCESFLLPAPQGTCTPNHDRAADVGPADGTCTTSHRTLCTGRHCAARQICPNSAGSVATRRFP